jgi:tRNA(adenine34) deaminase
MSEALIQAEAAAERDEVPVGAVFVYKDEIISTAGNEVEARHDPTAHAEMIVLQEAAKRLQSTYLTEGDLYVTLEPCPMCAHAIALFRVRRLYFGAYDPKGGGVDHGPRIFDQTTCHHRPEIIGGFDEQRCGSLLQQFFQRKR